MRILHLAHTLDPRAGGPSIVIRRLCGTFNKKGHHAEIALLDKAMAGNFNEDGCRIHFLGPGLAKYGYTPKLVPWLKAHARGFDAVIVHGIWEFHSFGAWLALHGSDTPYFVFTHGMLDPWFKKAYPFKHIKKLLYWPWAEYRVLRDAKAVFFTSEEERQLAGRSFRQYKCNEVVVNYGIVEPPGEETIQRSVFFERFPLSRGKKILLFMGRIHPKKGCDILVRAFSRIAAADPSLMLVMAGPDQVGWERRLKQEAQRFSAVGRIVWAGMLEGDQKWGALRCADALVLPSHQENFGVVIAEAMACGTPVMISNKVNIWREVLADGAGFVSNDDEKDLFDMLRKWAGLTDAEKSEMSANARRSFWNRFRIERTADDILRVIGDADAGKNRS